MLLRFFPRDFLKGFFSSHILCPIFVLTTVHSPAEGQISMGHLLARTTQQDAQKSEDTSSSATDALLRIQLERGHGTWTDDTEGRVDAPSYQAAIDGQQFAEG